jgi:myosin heavy chain 9/10/11/14
VVRHAEKERSFHIFYQLLEGTNAEQRTKYLLEPAKAYRYLENSARIEGGDDAAEFRDTIAAMATIGFKEREMDDLYRILSGILHLGNMAFTQGKRDDAANRKDSAIADKVSHTLGIKSPDFSRCLLKPRVKAGREWVTAMVTASKVRTARRPHTMKRPVLTDGGVARPSTRPRPWPRPFTTACSSGLCSASTMRW